MRSAAPGRSGCLSPASQSTSWGTQRYVPPQRATYTWDGPIMFPRVLTRHENLYLFIFFALSDDKRTVSMVPFNCVFRLLVMFLIICGRLLVCVLCSRPLWGPLKSTGPQVGQAGMLCDLTIHFIVILVGWDGLGPGRPHDGQAARHLVSWHSGLDSTRRGTELVWVRMM